MHDAGTKTDVTEKTSTAMHVTKKEEWSMVTRPAEKDAEDADF